MANAKKDQNGKATIICASLNDGVTIVPLKADPATHILQTMDGSTGSDNGNNNGNAIVDGNGVPVWTAFSSVDGKTIVEVYADPATGNLLIKST